MKQVKLLLESFGLGNRYIGFHYIIMAIELIKENEARLQAVHKEIYTVIAKAYNCKYTSVERSIRVAIGRAWTINESAMKELAPYPLLSKPSNAEFLELLSQYALK